MYKMGKQQVLLHSTGSYTQYPVINCSGEEHEKECVCIHVTNSLLYSRNENNIVNQLQFNNFFLNTRHKRWPWVRSIRDHSLILPLTLIAITPAEHYPQFRLYETQVCKYHVLGFVVPVSKLSRNSCGPRNIIEMSSQHSRPSIILLCLQCYMYTIPIICRLPQLNFSPSSFRDPLNNVFTYRLLCPN